MAKLEGKVIKIVDEKGLVRIPRTLAKVVELDDERNLQETIETLTSDLNSLEEKIDNFEGIADLSNVYTKKEVDDKIAEIKIPEKMSASNVIVVEGKDDEESPVEEINLVDALESIQQEIVRIDSKEVSIEGLATEEYVDTRVGELIDGAPEALDTLKEIADALNENDSVVSSIVNQLTEKANISEIERLEEIIEGIEVPSIEGLASTEYVDQAIGKIEIPSIEGLATEEYVQEKISEIEFPEFDYVGLATEEYVQEQISKIEIPSIDGLATEEYVQEKFDSIPEVDLSSYATQEFVGQKIAEIEIPSIEGLATEVFVTTKIAEAQLNNGNDVDLSGYATKDDLVGLASEEFVKEQISEIEIPSIEGLATEEFVMEQVQAIEIPEVDLSDYATKSELSTKLEIEKHNFEENVVLKFSKNGEQNNLSLLAGDEEPEEIRVVLSDELYEVQEALEEKIDSIEVPVIDIEAIIAQVRGEFEAEIEALNIRIMELEENKVVMIPDEEDILA